VDTEELLALAEEEVAAEEVPAGEEVPGAVATEDEDAAGELGFGFAGLLEPGLAAVAELLPSELLELFDSAGFSSLLEHAKKTPPIAKASKNKIPNTLFILSPSIYLSILLGK